MIWIKYNIVKGEVGYWQFYDKKVFIKGIDNRLAFAVEKAEPQGSIGYVKTISDKEIPAELGWNNVAVEKELSVHLQPSMPDRPLLVKFDEEIRILSGRSIMVYLKVPVTVHFYEGKINAEHLFFELPSADLSSTWLGTSDSGVLSYTLHSTNCFSFDEVELKENEVVCPVKISNESDALLKIDSLQLEVEFLRIYEGAGKLVSNTSVMKFKGENANADVQYIKRPPDYIKDLKLLTPERNTSSKSIIKKSFDFFKSGISY